MFKAFKTWLSSIKTKLKVNSPDTIAFKGVAYQSSTKIVKMLCGMLIFTWMARVIGPSNMGIITYVSDYVGIFMIVVIFGIDEVLVNRLVLHKDNHLKTEEYLGTVFYFRLALALVCWVLIFVIGLFVHNDKEVARYSVISGWVLLGSVFQTFVSFYYSKVKIKGMTISALLSWLSANTLRVVGIIFIFPVWFFIFCYNYQTVMDKFFVFIQFRKTFSNVKMRFNKDVFKDVFYSAAPMAFTFFIVFLETRMGTFFIVKYLSYEDLGQYNVAKSLAEIGSFLPVSVSATMFPFALRYYNEKNHTLFQQKLDQLYSLVLGNCFLFILGLLIFSRYFTTILFGSQYLAASGLVKYFSLLILFTYLDIVRTKWYVLEKKIKVWFLLNFFIVALSLLFQFILVPRIGLYGPIFSFFVAQVITNLVFTMFSTTVRADHKNIMMGFLYLIRKSTSFLVK